MWYWNQANFAGMLSVADTADQDPSLTVFAEYCRLREGGLRKQAFIALHRFILTASESGSGNRRSIVEWILTAHELHPDAHHLLPQPLLEKLIFPTLEEWLVEEPGSADARRWLGILRKDTSLLVQALERNLQDDVARKHLITLLLDDVEHATHHLVEGRFIGSIDLAIAKLDRVDSEMQQLTDRRLREALAAQARSLSDLVADWQEYSRVRRDQAFREWCEQRGSSHRWWSIVYYQT